MKPAHQHQIVKILKTDHPRLAKAFAGMALGSLDDHTLDQLVEMAAESAEIEEWKDAEATPEVKKLAKKFEAAVEKELEAYQAERKEERNDPVTEAIPGCQL